jgi:AcrR family transcriptional regulator
MGRDVGQARETGQPGRRRRPPLITPEQAVAAAYGLVEQEGPEGLSMRKLAGVLHVSLPTVYTAVASREALIGELQERLIRQLGALLDLIGEPTAAPTAIATGSGPEGTPPPVPGGPTPSLAEMADRVLSWAGEHERLIQFLVAEPVTASVAARLVASGSPDERQRLGRVLAELAGGPVAAGFDPVGALAYVVGEARAALALARDPALSAVAPERWLAIARDNVVAGLRSLAGRPARLGT